MKKIFTQFLLLVAVISAAKAQTTQTFTTSGNFVVPAGVTSIFVEAWGSGGSGGGAKGTVSFRGMGGAGGGGAYNSGTIVVSPGDNIAYTVAPQTAASVTTPVNGTASTFSTVTADGGTGGEAVTATTAHIGGTGGTGGVGQFNGGNGGSSFGFAGSTTGTTAGGGGGGGTTAAGGDGGAWSTLGAQSNGGAGGVSDGGAGAIGRGSSGNNGLIGTAPGGGGSGAYAAASTTQRTGGAGARGQVRITYTAMVVVPVTIHSFTGSYTNKTSLLKWNVGEEINITKYAVERSTDGRSFSEIGSVNATGSYNYSYTDATAKNAINFYRLRVVGPNELKYTVVVKVLSDVFGGKVNVYPSPAINKLNAEFTSENKTMANVQMTDAGGRIVLQKNMPVEQGYNNLNFDVNTLNKGMYILKITVSGKVISTGFNKL